ncbi:MAG: T9SS type A sorting domain-containing protein [Flavobacteriales bacterium]|nr:T9SS type A sorting domain-containing protein [Flavobacteriales bacterium]
MSRYLFYFLLFFLFENNLYSQNIELWGITELGGEYNSGTIFKTDNDGSNHTVIKSFHKYEGAGSLYTKFCETPSGNFYNLLSSGGLYNKGVLIQYNPSTNDYTKKFEFDSLSGDSPHGNLLYASDGNLYGMTYKGGTNNLGIIFKYNPTTETFLKLFDFDGVNGQNPENGLFQAANGKLYGVTSGGGLNSYGVIFELDITTNSFQKKYDFTNLNEGAIPFGNYIEVNNGLIYGITLYGGLNLFGVIYQYDYINNTYTKKIDFNSTISNYNNIGSLTLLRNGKILGINSSGGNNNLGVLYDYDYVTNNITKKLDFNGVSNGSNPCGTILETTNGSFFGMTTEGGVNNTGILYEFDTITNSLTKIIDFQDSIGTNPFGSLHQSANGKIYGITQGGGIVNGVVFEFDTISQIPVKKINLNWAEDGSIPQQHLLKANDGNMYGVTASGGTYNLGTLFRINLTNGVYTKLHDFGDISQERTPLSGLIQATNGKIYGTTSYGGITEGGVIFEYDIIQNSYIKKVEIDRNNHGNFSQSTLLEASDGNIYGCASAGGIYNAGTLFQYNPFTNTLTKKVDFKSDSIGDYPFGCLIELNNKLFGITNSGGINTDGVLFEYDINAEILTKKGDFNWLTTGTPSGALVKAVNGKLYGIASSGGLNGYGTIYEFDTLTNNISIKFDFDDINSGKYPIGSLILSGNKLYGMTTKGGLYGFGVIFEFDPTNSNFINKHNFNAYNGNRPIGKLIEIQTVGIEDFELFNESIYPNPVSTHLNITNLSTLEEIELNIIDNLGRLIDSFKSRENNIIINVASYNPGLYFISIKKKNYLKTIKIIKN